MQWFSILDLNKHTRSFHFNLSGSPQTFSAGLPFSFQVAQTVAFLSEPS